MDISPLSNYTVIQSISKTRRFSLYHARKNDSGREVLIKTPDAFKSKDPNLVRMLLNEGRAHQRLFHPRIRSVYEVLEDNGTAYMVGEYIAGTSLVRYIAEAPNPPEQEQILAWLVQLLEATNHAHTHGITHLNLNPYNVIVDKQNKFSVIGFGRAKTAFLNGEEGFCTYHPILFVAPELFQAGITVPAADLYSFAVIAYWLLCGVPPWRVDLQLTPEQQKKQSLGRAVIMPEILKKEVPDWLFAALLQCLKLDPAQRFGSAGELLEVIKNRGSSITEPIQEEVEVTIEEPEPEPEPEVVILEPQPEIEVIEDGGSATVGTPPAEPIILEPEVEELLPESPLTQIIEILEAETKPHEEPLKQPDYLFPAEPEELMLTEPEPTIPQPSVTPHSYESRNLPNIEPIEEQEPSIPQPEELPEPVEEEIPPPPEPVEEPQHIIQQPTPHEEKPIASPPPAPKPAYTTPSYQSYANQHSSPKDESDSTSLKKPFKILLYASLVIVLFVLIKYVAFEFRPRLGTTADTTNVELPEVKPAEENQAIAMIKVHADTLVMGSVDPVADDDEFPLLTLKVPSFYISKAEITQSEWMMVFADNPSVNKGRNFPVENISFYEAIEFCNAKSLKDGFKACYDFYDTEVECNFDADGYRLPTEAEWEFAAKAASHRDFTAYSGGDNPDEVGWSNANSNAQSHQVMSKKPNKLGVFDLSGNLFEWVWNWYAPYTSKTDDQFKGPSSGTDKVIRGGSWYHPSSEMRVTNRNFAKPYAKNAYTGFRVVRRDSIE